MKYVQGAEAKYEIIFVLISPIFEKKRDKSKFYDWLYNSSTFLKIKIQPKMNEQEQKRKIIYDV